jgi:hypothetical protein
MDPDFKRYASFGQQWRQEVSTLRLQSHGDETRFYYAGMAQAMLLDRLSPRWRKKVLQDNVCLEDLLEESIASIYVSGIE